MVYILSRLHIQTLHCFGGNNSLATWLGEAGYPSQPFLFTPLANPQTPAEQRKCMLNVFAWVSIHMIHKFSFLMFFYWLHLMSLYSLLINKSFWKRVSYCTMKYCIMYEVILLGAIFMNQSETPIQCSPVAPPCGKNLTLISDLNYWPIYFAMKQYWP